MAGPYWIVWGWCQEEREGPFSDLAVAVLALAVRRGKPWRWLEPVIHCPDGYDVDNADGLDRNERDQISEAGL